MSNHLAIATVTAALKETIRAAIAVDGTFQGFTIRTERPQNPPPAPAGPGVFVFLYQAMPASKQPSTDLRTRRSDGSVVQRPARSIFTTCFRSSATKTNSNRSARSRLSHALSMPSLQ
jgi:hypothetical protein